MRSADGGKAFGEPSTRRLAKTGIVAGVGSIRPNAAVSICGLPWKGGEGQFAVGRRSGRVEVVETIASHSADDSADCEASLLFECGLPVQKGGAGAGDLLGLMPLGAFSVASCTTSGVVEVWRPSSLDGNPEAAVRLNTLASNAGQPSSQKLDLDPGRPAECFSTWDNLVAVAGKANNARVFDLGAPSAEEPIFHARSAKPNELGIWEKPWVTCCGFVPGEGGQLVALGTAEHQVRLYDRRVKRRPVLSVDFGENKVTCLCFPCEEGASREVWCANATGQIRLVDLRTAGEGGEGVGASLKGALGCVRSLTRHPDPAVPLVFACGLDRHLRVFDLRRRKQVKSVYLKQYLNDAAVVVAGAGGEPAGQAQEEEEGELRRKKAKRARRS